MDTDSLVCDRGSGCRLRRRRSCLAEGDLSVSFRYLVVDEHWTHLGWFESEIPDWSVGQEFTLSDGRRMAIAGIVPNPDPDAHYTATWTVEPA